MGLPRQWGSPVHPFQIFAFCRAPVHNKGNPQSERRACS